MFAKTKLELELSIWRNITARGLTIDKALKTLPNLPLLNKS